jgi:hypothetical protein
MTVSTTTASILHEVFHLLTRHIMVQRNVSNFIDSTVVSTV